jgi:hypothetical protein
VSTESIPGITSERPALETCATCAAPMADDQRYCLECGARRADRPSFFLDALNARDVGLGGDGPAAAPAPAPSGRAPVTTTTVLWGVGLLLLAMAIGVLVGRAGHSSTPPPQVITVGGAAASGTAAGSAPTSGGTAATTPTTPSTGASTAVTDTWVGASGYAIQLVALPSASTQSAAVDGAEADARRKGAAAVGVLVSSSHSGLAAGQYIVYSGNYPTSAAATAALGRLKASYPSAMVIHVVSAGGTSTPAPSSSSPSGGSSSSPSGSGTHPGASTPASPSNGGQSYEKKSLALPNQVGT